MNIALAEKELSLLDPKMGELITAHGTLHHEPRSDYFTALTRSIIGQRISVKAAAKIFERFEAITQLEPKVVAGLNDEQVKSSDSPRKNHDTSKTSPNIS